jgi:nucleoside phosphorylase
VINFGTCGAYLNQEFQIGDVLIGKSCFYIDRLRSLTQDDFEWGIWGGGLVRPQAMIKELALKSVNLGCQIGNYFNVLIYFLGYIITDIQKKIMERLQIKCIDMECASIA